MRKFYMNPVRSIALSGIYFLLGAILSIAFIASKSWLYDSVNLMILSAAIAGGKWFIQIVAALILLREHRFTFLKKIGLVCLIGSAMLFSYYLLPRDWGFAALILPVAGSVVTMIVLYYRAVKQTPVSMIWFWGWMSCLVVAITLQLTIVFDAAG